jgi:hypothetical protein
MTILYCGFDEVNMHCFQSHIWRYRPKVEPQFVPFTEMKRNDCSYMFLQPESRTAKRIRWRTSILLRGYVWMWKHLEISNSGRNGHPSKWTMVTMMDSSHAGVLPRHRLDSYFFRVRCWLTRQEWIHVAVDLCEESFVFPLRPRVQTYPRVQTPETATGLDATSLEMSMFLAYLASTTTTDIGP